MTLTNDEIFSVNIDSSEEFKNEQFAALTLNTLGIAGPSMKGPAFVPKNIQVFESNSSRTGILNTFEDTFGKESEMTSYNNTIASVSEWFAQGGEQLNFTRILGVGKTGIPDDEGIVSGSGFIVGGNIVSGSSTPGFKGSNPFSLENAPAGKTLFISSTFEEITYNNAANPTDVLKISPFDDFLTQEGLSTNNQELFTHVVLCTSGSNLVVGNDINSTVGVENLLEARFKTLFDFSDARRYIDNNRKNNFSESYLNTEPRHILTKGHLVYSKFLPHSALINKKIKLVQNNDTFHNINESNNNNNNPSYENFVSPFKTAKTPWVTSQILNKEGLSKNREDIIDKCKKLFRFHALDDGESGNNFKITITPLRIGDSKNRTWSKFSIQISIYNRRTNKFIKKLNYSNLNLDPNSKKYICRAIGTEHSYYDFDSGKVVTTGIYPQKNNYLRVEINSQIEFEDLNIYELMPCGFLPYPAFNTNNLNNIEKFPLLYVKNLRRSPRDLDKIYEKSSWGVSFDDFKISEDENIIFQGGLRCNFEVSQHIESPEDNVSIYYDHTKYYQDNFINVERNVWDYNLSTEQAKRDFFHLEKIIYPGLTIENRFTNWLYAMYRKDGKVIDQIDTIHDGNPLEYAYIDTESMLKSNSGAPSPNSKFLSFSFFTYGGFDGTNILDFDKYRMNQNAFVKELENEEQDANYLNNSPMPTYSAYKLANKIITDDSNCEVDILSFPEVGHGIFNKSISDEAGENRRYLAVLNVPEFNNSGIIKDFEFYDIDFSEPSLNDQQSLRDEIREDLKDGINLSLNDMSQRFFNNRFTVNVCNTTEGIVDLDNIAHKRFVVHPATLLIRSFSSSMRLPADSLNTFSDSNISYSIIYNSTFNDSGNNDFSRVIDNALPFNLNYIVSKRNSLNVNSTNTSVSRRNSLTRFSHNTRIMLDIKKNIKYLLYTNDILFNNNSKLKTINIILNRDLTSLLNSYVESGMIKDFYVKLGTGNTLSEQQDNLNNILKSKIAISLFGKDRDNIEEIRLDELVNITKNNLTQTADRDIVLTRI